MAAGSDVQGVQLVLLNKHQISGGGAYLDCHLHKIFIKIVGNSLV